MMNCLPNALVGRLKQLFSPKDLYLDPEVCIPTQQPGAQKNARTYLAEVFSLVLKLNGTLSGEHGIGLEKRDYISRELDNNTLQLMHDIKQQLDPNNILNPGKIPLVS